MILRFGSVLIAVLALGLLGCSSNPDFPTCENADPLCFGACDYPDGTSTGLTLDACQQVQDACEAGIFKPQFQNIFLNNFQLIYLHLPIKIYSSP